MRQAQKKQDKDKVAIALMLTFCVIALTSIFTIKSNIDKINGSAPDPELLVSEQTQTSEDTTPPPAENPSSEGDTQVSAGIPTVDSVQPSGQSSEPAAFASPVNSDQASITNVYSMDSLIYSITLDQYMTHCGLDIEAPKDTQVLAAAPGTVTAIYEDDRYGTSIEITHDDGFVTIYSNLSDGVMVEIGDVVDQGKIIGGIGTSGLFESLEPAHLHLEMLLDGVYVDPAEHIRF